MLLGLRKLGEVRSKKVDDPLSKGGNRRCGEGYESLAPLAIHLCSSHFRSPHGWATLAACTHVQGADK